MPNLVPRNGALTRHDPRRLALFKNTVGKDLSGTEIDQAIEFCEIYGANPFTKDIYFFVFDAKKPDRRRMVPVLGIGLYRKIAARSNNYRPDEQPPRFRYDETLKGPGNPRGILDCEITIYRFAHGAWHPSTSRIRWEERAPLVDHCEKGFDYVDTGETWEDSGNPKKKRVPKGEITFRLDPQKKNWSTMPETMLAKCTEADAIRRAWPNETAGSYVEGELDAAHTIELTATEIIENEEEQRRLNAAGIANSILISWGERQPLQPVPVAKLGDEALKFIREHAEEPGVVMMWKERNRHGLNEYWARDKDGALAVKKAIEKVAALLFEPVPAAAK